MKVGICCGPQCDAVQCPCSCCGGGCGYGKAKVTVSEACECDCLSNACGSRYAGCQICCCHLSCVQCPPCAANFICCREETIYMDGDLVPIAPHSNVILRNL